jgi:hypothetical protein
MSETPFTQRDLELPPAVALYVRLEDLPDPEHPGGRRVRLREPTRATLRLARTYDEDRTANVDLLWEIAAALLPDLAPEDVDRLSYTTIHRIMQAAQEPVLALEEIQKNAPPPTA